MGAASIPSDWAGAAQGIAARHSRCCDRKIREGGCCSPFYARDPGNEAGAVVVEDHAAAGPDRCPMLYRWLSLRMDEGTLLLKRL